MFVFLALSIFLVNAGYPGGRPHQSFMQQQSGQQQTGQVSFIDDDQGTKNNPNLFQFCYRNHISFVGDDLSSLTTQTMDECTRACKTAPDCMFADFNTFTGLCKLQSTNTHTYGNWYHIAVSLWCGQCYHLNHKYPNPVATSKKNDVESCKQPCLTSASCMYYSYNPTSKHCEFYGTDLDWYNPIVAPGTTTQKEGCTQVPPPFAQEVDDDPFMMMQRSVMNVGGNTMPVLLSVVLSVTVTFATMALFVYCKKPAEADQFAVLM